MLLITFTGQNDLSMKHVSLLIHEAQYALTFSLAAGQRQGGSLGPLLICRAAALLYSCIQRRKHSTAIVEGDADQFGDSIQHQTKSLGGVCTSLYEHV